MKDDNMSAKNDVPSWLFYLRDRYYLWDKAKSGEGVLQQSAVEINKRWPLS